VNCAGDVEQRGTRSRHDANYLARKHAFRGHTGGPCNNRWLLRKPHTFAVAKAVALQAIKDGVAGPLDEQTLESRIRANIWEPVYLPYRFDTFL